jgi:hypothetical protein
MKALPCVLCATVAVVPLEALASCLSSIEAMIAAPPANLYNVALRLLTA